jgi:hypothetical protein
MMLLRASVMLLLLWATSAYAHKASTSYLQLRIDGQTIDGRWDIALRDLDVAIGLDTDGDTQLTWGELRRQQSRIGYYALGRLALQADREPCTLAVRDLLVADHSDGRYASLALTGHCPHAPVDLAIDYQLLFDLDAWHRGLLALDHRGSQAGLFGPDGRSQHFIAGDANVGEVFTRYFQSGVWHVRTGWDHILFLVGLFLPAVLRRHKGGWHVAGDLRQTLTDAALMVTAFTLAHALTLSLTAIGMFSLPARWVEAGVAASVMFAGLNNLVPMVYRRLIWLAAGFGLLHGAAMAGALIELGLPTVSRVWSLLAFNLGVEVAQLAVLLAVIPASFVFRRSRIYRWLVLVPGSILITLVGFAWLVQRGGGIDLGFTRW